VLPYYGKRILSKGARLSGLAKIATAASPAAVSRLHLWSEPEVQTLLRPEAMALGSLMDQIKLKGFLEASRHPQFGLEEPWARLLTLEHMLRALKELRHPPRKGE
jgi:hypothetical protein